MTEKAPMWESKIPPVIVESSDVESAADDEMAPDTMRSPDTIPHAMSESAASSRPPEESGVRLKKPHVETVMEVRGVPHHGVEISEDGKRLMGKGGTPVADHSIEVAVVMDDDEQDENQERPAAA